MVTVDRRHRATKVATVVQDLFQDVMRGNCASIQSIMRRVGAGPDGASAFYAAKARHARATVAGGTGAGLFSRFEPDQYASFSSFGRRDTLTTSVGPGSPRSRTTPSSRSPPGT